MIFSSAVNAFSHANQIIKGGSYNQMKLGTTELLVILAIVILVFGPSQLPKLSRMFGKSVKNFRSGMDGEDASADKENDMSSESSDENL